MTTKICTKCNVEKDIDDFHKKKSGTLGRNSMCKECRSKYIKSHYNSNKSQYIERSKKWKQKNPIRVLSQRYNIDESIIEEMWIKYDSCGICSTTENLVFDHIHDTNTARGFLCSNCNTMLGRLGDTNKEILDKIERIIKYCNIDVNEV